MLRQLLTHDVQNPIDRFLILLSTIPVPDADEVAGKAGSEGKTTDVIRLPNHIIEPLPDSNDLDHHPKLRALLLRHAEGPRPAVDVARVFPDGFDASFEEMETVALTQVLDGRVVVDLVEFFDVVDFAVHEGEAVGVGAGGGGGGGGGWDVFVVPEGPDVGEGGWAHALEHVEFGGFAVGGLGGVVVGRSGDAVAGRGTGAVFGDGRKTVDSEGRLVGRHVVDGDVSAFFGGPAERFPDRPGDVALSNGILSRGAGFVDRCECSESLDSWSNQLTEFVGSVVELLGNLSDSGVPVLAE